MMRPHSPALWWADLVFVLALSATCWAAAGNYLQPDLFIWGDHPGQFMRFWHTLAYAVPESRHVVDWVPHWYAGYPELQFYPPGHVLVGLALNYATLNLLPPESVYNGIVFVAYVLPAFTFYTALRMFLAPLGQISSAIGGFAAALLALGFSPMWGGTDAVVIGLLGERLAFGIAPLALVAGVMLVNHPGSRRLAVAAAALAALLLAHPFHAPVPIACVGGYAVASVLRAERPPSLRACIDALGQRSLWLLAWPVLACGLIAWWLVPLPIRFSPYAAAMIRANTDQVISWLEAGPISWMWFAILPALTLLRHPRTQIHALTWVLAIGLPLVGMWMVFDSAILVDRLNLTLFDPVRFMASYYLLLLLLNGVAVGATIFLFTRHSYWLATGCAALLIVMLQPVAVWGWQNIRERSQVPKVATVSNALIDQLFADYWQALREDSGDKAFGNGRVLLLSHYLTLTPGEGKPLPSTINSMIPYYTGREIVGGTFSHWSPVARHLWTGNARIPVLPAHVEVNDDQQIFGVPWAKVDAAWLHRQLTELNVSTIVAHAEDTKGRGFLDASPLFARYWENGSFFLYRLADTPDAPTGWIAFREGSGHLVERTPRRWVIRVEDSAAQALLTVKMAHYPLWRAQARYAVGKEPLRNVADANALQQIVLPEGKDYTVYLDYREGWPEWSGFVLTMISLVVTAGLLWPLPRRKPRLDDALRHAGMPVGGD